MDEQQHSSPTPTNPPLPRWYPVRCCSSSGNNGKPVYHGNPEALGWAMDIVGRSAAFIGSGAFLGTALLRLAKESVGCAVEPLDDSGSIPACDERLFGILRPSSLLTTYTIVVGMVSAALLPLLGAVVDYTPHRRLIGRCFSVTFCVLLLPQIAIGPETWLAVAILQIGVAFVGWAQSMVTYAYLPELTDSAERLSGYTQSYTVLSFSSMVIYIVVTVGVASAAGFADDTVATARLGMAIAFVISCVFLSAAWGSLMQKRPAARTLSDGQSLWTAGFIQVYRTSIHVYHHLPALKWFYLSIALIDAGVQYVFHKLRTRACLVLS